MDMIKVKRFLRVVIGTLIFLPMSPIWLLVGWVITDKLTLGGAARDTWSEYKRLLKGHI